MLAEFERHLKNREEFERHLKNRDPNFEADPDNCIHKADAESQKLKRSPTRQPKPQTYPANCVQPEPAASQLMSSRRPSLCPDRGIWLESSLAGLPKICGSGSRDQAGSRTLAARVSRSSIQAYTCCGDAPSTGLPRDADSDRKLGMQTGQESSVEIYAKPHATLPAS